MKKVEPMTRPNRTKPEVQMLRSMKGTVMSVHYDTLTRRKLERPTMPRRFGFPFSDHGAYLFHLFVFVWILPMGRGRLEEAAISSSQIWQKCACNNCD